MIQVASFGGGVNSTAMLLGMYERGEKVDLVLFADTGGEKPETYRHKDEFSAWLLAHGMPEIIEVRRMVNVPAEQQSHLTDYITLEQECLDKKTLPSIVTGIRSCSDQFKIRPQDRYLRVWQPAIQAWERGEKVTKLIGFDAGEPHRVKDFTSTKYQNRYPLIEWDWAREQCLETIRRHGLEAPPKSSCFFCPEMQEWEIVQLAQDSPELFERAVAMERNNTALTQIKGLARTHTWESVAQFHGDQLRLDGSTLLPPRAESLPCICYDGE
jgi:hypothetical protein